MSNSIEAVTFDVGGTLIQPWPSVGHVYAEVAARYGMTDLSAEMLNERFKAAWRVSSSFGHAREDWKALVDEVFRGATREVVAPKMFDELYERFSEPVAWRVFDDVLPALEKLTLLGVRRAIISNWDERLRILLKRLHLDQYFETFTISCEAGLVKPSPRLFEIAAQSLGLVPGSILHVGDSIELDLEPAKLAGFQALIVDRSGGTVAPHSIRSLNEIVSTS
jgi:putative hydrolase of the HAD superfamily